MTVQRTVVVAVLSLAVLSVTGAACSGSGTGTSRQRTSMVTIAAAGTPAAPHGGQSIPVIGGTVTLQSASVSIEHVRIEEETDGGGHQGGQQEGSGHHEGQENGGQENGSHEDGGGQSGGGENEDEIVIEGPFAIDIASGSADLQAVAVFPGTFRQAHFNLHLETQSPFDGDSIVIQGQFQPTSGDAVPFTLRSHLARELEVPIANGGITVANNAEVTITVTFDLAAMFAHLDLHSAVVESGAIAIDGSHNATLLSTFEHHLEDALEGCEGHH